MLYNFHPQASEAFDGKTWPEASFSVLLVLAVVDKEK
jgi:hypothetical protein